MTAQPIDRASHQADFFRRLHEQACDRLSVPQEVRDAPEHAAALRSWIDILDIRFPLTDAHPAAEEVQVEAPAEEEALAFRRRQSELAWEDTYTNVHADVLVAYSVPHALAIIRLRRMATERMDNKGKKRQDIYINPARDAARLGVSVRTLREWLSPGGALAKEVWLRTDKETGALAYLHPREDGDRWLADLRPIKIKRDKKGKVKKGKGDRFVGIPSSWTYENPDLSEGDRWVRTGFSDAAIYGAAVVKAEARGARSVQKGIDYLAIDNGKSAKAMRLYVNAAEDAGLVTVTNRGGHTGAWRRWHTTPAEAPTVETRVPNQPLPEGVEPLPAPAPIADPADWVDPEPPF